ncbi:hypothetical protein J7T55_005239 [Diaporthe amygdali]|uniref:uncharacterized protein n=1 Tax=Phomopsis amygdali TaxID=1214568 RepID=UPI0022FF112C|nr:uncharacterized protein J7T55_005239 [Diaporthe amygdali]KAJ0116293.1 hypothetical protein J7T55_005239 [Diaporthe amygdali]
MLVSTRALSSHAKPTEAQLDFRQFLEKLREDNDLVDIKDEIDPYLEAAAIVRRVSETDNLAPLFHNIKGAKGGLWRMFGNAASLRPDKKEKYGRLARNLGLEPTATWKELTEKTIAAKKRTLLKPNVLPTAPCKKNSISAEEINLHELPVPQVHAEDGGKYMQTYGIHVLQTPNKGWTNWSIFRGMVHDRNHLCCLVGSGQHNSMIRDEWRKMGAKEMPWALALGVPPAANLVAALPIPKNVSEGEYVGALVGKPLDLVKCDNNDLLVPASSEIVLEGALLLEETGMEGPFGDFLGVVFDGDAHKQPLFRVDKITYRDDAILPISVPGRITDESHTTAALAAGEVLSLCGDYDIPIKEACASLEVMGTWLALQIDTEKLRALKTNPKDFVNKLGKILFNHKSCMLINKIILVGDHVNVYEFRDVMWALATRCRPGRDEYVFEDVPGFPMTPYMSHGGHGPPTKGGKAICDALMPAEYTTGCQFHEVSFEKSYPKHVRERIESNWQRGGFNKV